MTPKKKKTELRANVSQGQSFRVAIVLKKAHRPPRKRRKDILLNALVKQDKTMRKMRKGKSTNNRKARLRQQSNKQKIRTLGSKRRISRGERKRGQRRKRRSRQSRSRKENFHKSINELKHQHCTGSIIRQKWVLTAANCFDVSPPMIPYEYSYLVVDT